MEYRFLMEATKNWTVRIVDRSDLMETGDPGGQVEKDVSSGVSNFALCSAWLTDHLLKDFDVTGYSSHLCGTFLVPRPAPIPLASYIIYPLEDEVWIAILCFLVFTGLLYHCFSRIATSHTIGHWLRNFSQNSEEEVDTLGRSFLDVVNVFTSHGLPRILQRTSVRMLITTWLVLCFFLCTAYSTKLMSVLARPLFTKAVDSVADFVREGLFWGEIGERETMKRDFLDSGNADYIELAQRLQVEKDLEERHRNLQTGRYARFVKTLNNKYVMDTETIANYTSQLRLMKSCVNEYFTVFPFDKKSPYTRYFNMKLGRLKEAGIIRYWLGLMAPKSYMRSLVEEENKAVAVEPKPLNLGQFSGSFYVLGIGLGLALLSFLGELYVHKRSVRREEAGEVAG